MTPRVLAICGHSGAGKTTLIEELVTALAADGWRVAVQKRTHHAITVDVPGKDSDRCFRAGATVCLLAPDQVFVRRHSPAVDADAAWRQALEELVETHDVVLVEGHKATPLPKVWLLAPGETEPPAGITEVRAVLDRDAPRRDRVLALIRARVAGLAHAGVGV